MILIPVAATYERPIEEGGGETSTFPFEDWRYRYLEGIGQEVMIEFVDTCMCGDYHMTIDRGEKDALLHTPNGGATLYEQMGMASKANRFNGGLETLGPGPDSASQASKEFDRLEQFAKLQAPPPVKFKDLEEVVSHKISINLMPFDVRADFVKVTAETVLVPFTIQMKNRDITFVNKDGVQRGVVNIFGRVTTLTGPHRADLRGHSTSGHPGRVAGQVSGEFAGLLEGDSTAPGPLSRGHRSKGRERRPGRNVEQRRAGARFRG